MEEVDSLQFGEVVEEPTALNWDEDEAQMDGKSEDQSNVEVIYQHEYSESGASERRKTGLARGLNSISTQSQANILSNSRVGGGFNFIPDLAAQDQHRNT